MLNTRSEYMLVKGTQLISLITVSLNYWRLKKKSWTRC